MDADEGGDFSSAVGGFHQSVNLVSLLAGKLLVTQSVLLLTWRLKQHESYSSLPFNHEVQKLHLQVASKTITEIGKAQKELTEKVSELAEAQTHTDQRLNVLIDILNEGRNGKSQS